MNFLLAYHVGSSRTVCKGGREEEVMHAGDSPEVMFGSSRSRPVHMARHRQSYVVVVPADHQVMGAVWVRERR